MKTLITLALALLAGVACTRRDESRAGDASTTAAEVPGRTAEVPPRAIEPPAAAADASAATAPATGTPATPPRPPPIEEPPLPSWVPEAGRLTIVQAPDLARNLGLDAAPPPAPAADAAP